MEFKDKIEAVLAPLVAEFRGKLALLPTLAVLNNYQLRIDTVQTDKRGVPDGFIIKWRYLCALLLSNSFSDRNCRTDLEFGSLDQLIENIFETYAIGNPQTRRVDHRLVWVTRPIMNRSVGLDTGGTAGDNVFRPSEGSVRFWEVACVTETISAAF